MRWRPIETAPRDGTWILGYGEDAGEVFGPRGHLSQQVIQYTGAGDYPGYEWQMHSHQYACWFKPTHWKPLGKDPE